VAVPGNRAGGSSAVPPGPAPAGLRYPEAILKRLVLATALLAGCLAHASSI
jgi:hypothetical protein